MESPIIKKSSSQPCQLLDESKPLSFRMLQPLGGQKEGYFSRRLEAGRKLAGPLSKLRMVLFRINTS